VEFEFAKLVPPYTDQPGPQAVARLVERCIQHRGSSTEPIADFVISLYNADYAKPDAYLLCRRIDDKHFRDVITVMTWFRSVPGGLDVHWVFGREGARLMQKLIDDFDRQPPPGR